MQEIRQRLQQLLSSGEWTVSDKEWLLEYLEGNNTPELRQLMQQEFAGNHFDDLDSSRDRAEYLLHCIHQKINPPSKAAVKMIWWKRIAAAAAVLLLMISTAYYFTNRNEKEHLADVQVNPVKGNDIAPGGNKAVLTLADNTTIVLDSAQNGTLAMQGSVHVIKTANGSLKYNDSDAAGAQVMYNTITTPRAGQYQLTLSDGTRVWLNAESSLKFPNAFSGKERRVMLSGEGYFEVAHNSAKPFHVAVQQMDVQVLGTHFNINAYADETSVKTTLLQGSVAVSEAGKTIKIKPGEQAEWSSNGISKKEGVNIEEVMAWKNGQFQFNNTGIVTVMNQISRWYNVDVRYPRGVPGDKYWGSILRNQNLSDVLKVLKETGANFKIEDRTIIVTP